MSVDAARATRAYWLYLAAACGLTLAWFLIYNSAMPHHGLVDEPGHLGDVEHFLQQKPGWPWMTMLPGYHYLVVTLWKLDPPCTLITLTRFVTTVFALIGLGVFTWTWRRLHPQADPVAAGRATLLLALLPILQPFTGMAYTDAPALTLIFAGVAAHFSGRPVLATVIFFISAVFRQTNLLWVVFVIACDVLDRGAAWRDLVRRHIGHVLLLVAAALIVLNVGRLTLATDTGNAAQPNIANLHLGAVLVLVLGLPVWLAHLPSTLRAARPKPARTFTLVVVGLAVAAGLALTFANPHIWNRELFWTGERFTLLRNWPLVYMERYPWLRVASGLNIVLMATALALVINRQAHRRHLWLALLFGLALPGVNGLVEPRYFIPAAGFFLLFAELPRADARRLLVWWAVLCAVHAPFVAEGVSLW